MSEAAPPVAQPEYVLRVRRPPGDPKLGRTALLLAVIVLVLSLIASVLIGLFATEFTSYSTGQSVGFNQQPDQLLAFLHFLGGTAIGVTAIVLGIRAIVLNRGRTFGIAAVIIAGVAPLVSAIVWGIAGFIAR